LGRYNKPEFGFWAAIACVVVALATLHLVERPVERLPRMIKKQSSLPALPGLPAPAAASPTVVTAG
jgi:hypothetical protein